MILVWSYQPHLKLKTQAHSYCALNQFEWFRAVSTEVREYTLTLVFCLSSKRGEGGGPAEHFATNNKQAKTHKLSVSALILPSN